MFKISQLLKPKDAHAVADEQLFDARVNYLHHAAAAEHHRKLAEMYLDRVRRLHDLPDVVKPSRRPPAPPAPLRDASYADIEFPAQGARS